MSDRRGSILVALSALAFAAGNVAIAGPALAAAGGHDRFKPTAPDVYHGGAEAMRTPSQFEAAAAGAPNAQTLFSRCRRAPFNSTTFYSVPATSNHDTIVGDTTFQFSNAPTESCYNPQNEQNIVINPTNSNNLVTSSNETRIDGFEVYFSSNGGASWTDVVLRGWTSSTGGLGVFAGLSSCGDPVLAFDPDGSRLYFSGLVCDLTRTGNSHSGIAVASSTDGGAHWGPPSMVTYTASSQYLNDKEWMTVAPDDGTVYVTWSQFVQGRPGLYYISSPIVMSRSTDDGQTWSSILPVSDAGHPFDQGSQPVVASDGTLYVAYEGARSDSLTGYPDWAIIARSTNGGSSFVSTELARVYDDPDCYPLQLPGAQDYPTLSYEQFRINSFPSLAIDPTNDYLAIVWADDQGAGNCGTEASSFVGTTSNQVKLMTSNSGTSWTDPTVITTGAADKVFPSVGANHGRIVVGYYTRSYSPNATVNNRACGISELTSSGSVVAPLESERKKASVCLDWALRSSTNGFASETRVTNQSSNPYVEFAGSFIGDYTGTAVNAAGIAVMVWTDNRGNPGVTTANQDAYAGTGY
jgi:hypothetical protein